MALPLGRKGEPLYRISKLMAGSPEVRREHYAALVPEKMAEVVEFEASTATAGRILGVHM